MAEDTPQIDATTPVPEAPKKEVVSAILLVDTLEKIQHKFSTDQEGPDGTHNREVSKLCQAALDTIRTPIETFSGLLTSYSTSEGLAAPKPEFQERFGKQHQQVFDAFKTRGINFVTTNWLPQVHPSDQEKAIYTFNQELRDGLELAQPEPNRFSSPDKSIINALEGGESRWSLRMQPEDVFELINRYPAQPSSSNLEEDERKVLMLLGVEDLAISSSTQPTPTPESQTESPDSFKLESLGPLNTELTQSLRKEPRRLDKPEGEQGELLHANESVRTLENPQLLKDQIDKEHRKLREQVASPNENPDDITLAGFAQITLHEIAVGDPADPGSFNVHFLAGIDMSDPNHPKYLIRKNGMVVPNGLPFSIVELNDAQLKKGLDKPDNGVEQIKAFVENKTDLPAGAITIPGLAHQEADSVGIAMRRLTPKLARSAGDEDLVWLDPGERYKVYYVQKQVPTS